MFDARLRPLLAPALDRAAAALDVPFVTPNRLTGLNLVLGLASAGFAAGQLWLPALATWLLCRLADGVDGPLARRRASSSRADSRADSRVDPRADPRAESRAEHRTSDGGGQGGFWDISADFVVYGATVVGVALGATSAFGAPWLPFMMVLFAYYLNGSVFLAFSSIAERTGRTIEDGRSLSFLGGLAEGAETVAVHSLWLLFPFLAWQIAVVWAFLVLLSAAQRIVIGYRSLT